MIMLMIKPLCSFTVKGIQTSLSKTNRPTSMGPLTLRLPVFVRSLIWGNGSFSRTFSKKITDFDRLGSIVDMHYIVAEKKVDETRSSNPIIILHGLLGSKDNWQSMARHLNHKSGRKVYAVDFRNHGTSPHTYVFSYEFMVCDLIFFMRLKNMRKATLIGHSMGGRVAMMLAMRYPELVQSMVVVDISPMSASPKMKANIQLLKDLKSLKLDEHLTLKEARQRTATQLKQKNYDDSIINFILLNMIDGNNQTNWTWKFNLDSILENYEKEILYFPIVSSPCNTRTLFLGGGASDYLPQKHLPHIKDLFPSAKFTYIEGAGHWVHAEKPIEFLDTVVDFLENDPKRIHEDAELHPLGRPVDLVYQKYDDHYDESKSDVPIIILHGLLGSKQNWNSMARQMNKKFGRVVYALDSRNHGESPHTEIFTYDMMMGDILVFCRKHNISKVTMIGHSMGGRVAMMLAMVYPVLVHSMVVVDMSPGRPVAGMSGIRQLLKDLVNLKLDLRLSPREARAEAGMQLREKIEDERVIAFILTNLVENASGSGRNWRWKFNLESIVKYFDTDIADFPVIKRDCKTRSLFIGGLDSDFIKPSDEGHIRKIFPQSQFEFVEGAGHWVHADKPQQFLEIVGNFLDEDP